MLFFYFDYHVCYDPELDVNVQLTDFTKWFFRWQSRN